MLKAGGTDREGKRFVVIGLSRVNCDRLLDGKPIAFEGLEIGIPNVSMVIIVAGETEDAIAQWVEANVGKLPRGAN